MRLLLDTNVIIDFLKQKNDAFDLTPLILQHECFISVIVKLELLKYPAITSVEEYIINNFLDLLPIMPLDAVIEKETIKLSRSTKLKLPDAIIGATAIAYSARLVTRDPHLINCQYDRLHLWSLI